LVTKMVILLSIMWGNEKKKMAKAEEKNMCKSFRGVKGGEEDLGVKRGGGN